ncbi:MAG: TIGR04255 family protein [Bryobacterales bacterium]|nr:TIGR04255 family protein [Bryobacterales bacterium]
MVPPLANDLPDFERPPVAETVLSVQFQRLENFRAAHFGLYWNRIRSTYPATEERLALEPVFERFAEPVRRKLEVQFPILEKPPLPRVWYVHDTKNELLQLQSDRFIRNWRKTGDGDSYPRYEAVRQRFDQDFQDFQAFLAEEDIGTVAVNQCEVTYVNHIVAGEGWSSHGELDRVFTMWSSPSGDFPGVAEDASVHARFPIRSVEGEPIGRLHVGIQAAIRESDGTPMFVVNLTARGMLGQSTEFFDLGRESIVRSFVTLTTPEMHNIWKRRR